MRFVEKGWTDHLVAVSQCLRALVARLGSDKLHSITFWLDSSNAKIPFHQLELKKIVPSLKNLPALRELVFVVDPSSVVILRGSLTRSFLRTPYLDMIRYESSKPGESLPVNSPPSPLTILDYNLRPLRLDSYRRFSVLALRVPTDPVAAEEAVQNWIWPQQPTKTATADAPVPAGA